MVGRVPSSVNRGKAEGGTRRECRAIAGASAATCALSGWEKLLVRPYTSPPPLLPAPLSKEGNGSAWGRGGCACKDEFEERRIRMLGSRLRKRSGSGRSAPGVADAVL